MPETPEDVRRVRARQIREKIERDLSTIQGIPALGGSVYELLAEHRTRVVVRSGGGAAGSSSGRAQMVERQPVGCAGVTSDDYYSAAIT